MKIADMEIAFYGDSFIDRWTNIAQVRINPENGSPVYLLDGESTREYPGGASNAARALEHYGVESLVAYPFACEVKERLGDRARIDHKLIAPDPLPFVNVLWQRDDLSAIVVSDYGKGAVTPTIMRRLVDLSKRLGIPLVVDGKYGPQIDYDSPHVVFKCNEAEARTLGMKFDFRSLAGFGLRHGCSVVVTRGAMPPVMSEPDVQPPISNAHFPQGRPFQASGAGDSFAAFLAYGLAIELPFAEAVRLAYNAAAAAGYFPPFRQPVLPREVEALTEPSRLKLLATVDELGQWLRHRVTGTICVTNGCFDLFHAGHLGCLQECRRQAGQLLVLVNTDESVARLKGSDRPIIPLDQRMRILAGLECVDAVACFDGEMLATLAECAKVLGRPFDVLAKGIDYETALGIEHAQRYHRCKDYGARTLSIAASR